jgi:hypothetical protein
MTSRLTMDRASATTPVIDKSPIKKPAFLLAE